MPNPLIDYGSDIGLYYKGEYVVALFGIIAVSIFLGTAFLLTFYVINEYKVVKQKRREKNRLKFILEYRNVKVNTSIDESLFSTSKEHNLGLISNFGLFFGGIGPEFSSDELKLLSQYQLLCLDGQNNDYPTSLRRMFKGKYLLSTFNLGKLWLVHQTNKKSTPTEFYQQALLNLSKLLNKRNGENGPFFDGIMFTGLDLMNDIRIIEPISNELMEYGVITMIQLHEPSYSVESLPNLQFFNGLMLTNVTLFSNGLRRDYFDMAPSVHNIIKYVTDQLSLRQDFTCLVFELISEVKGELNPITPAKISRLIKFTQFYKLIPWVSTQSALYEPCKNVPLKRSQNALEFMVKPDYQRAKACWIEHRVNTLVQNNPTDPDQSLFDYESWLPLLPSIDLLKSKTMCKAKQLERTNSCSIENYARYPFPPANVRGQFDYGTHPSATDFEQVVQTVSSLRKQGLLCVASEDAVEEHANTLEMFTEWITASFSNLPNSFDDDLDNSKERLRPSNFVKVMNNLVTMLRNNRIQILHGLDTGFKYNNIHFWSVYEAYSASSAVKRKSRIMPLNADPDLFIYISLKHPCDVGAIVASYISYFNHSYESTVLAEGWLEYFLTRKNDLPFMQQVALPRRITKQLSQSTPLELMTLMHSTQNSQDPIEHLVQNACKKHLIDDVQIKSQLELHSMELMTGKIDMKTFLDKRMKWYEFLALQSVGNIFDSAPISVVYQTFNTSALLPLWTQVHSLILDSFLNPKFPDMAQVFAEMLYKEYQKAGEHGCSPGPELDILACFYFAICKLLGYDEIRNITFDYNPMPAREPDQQGLIAELYTLGSRCQEFFDIPIDKLSEILYDDRTRWISQNVPPNSAYSDRRFMSLYLPLVQCGADFIKPRKKVLVQEIAAGLVFTFPATIDLILLLITGHGTYVNSAMSLNEQKMISYALFLTLLMTGVLSPLIASAGSYYFYLYQFPTMAAVILQQFTASLALLWLLGAIVGACIAIGNWMNGIIFLVYLVLFSTYFLCLASLSTIHSEGIPIPSGKKAIWLTFPMALAWWPISFFVDFGKYTLAAHASFWVFYVLLWLFMLRKLLRSFINWTGNIVQTDEKEILGWYTKKYGESKKEMVNKRENWKKQVARLKLEQEVKDYNSGRLRISMKTKDEFVVKMANGYPYTKFLIKWHSLNQGYDIPPAFGVEWNLNTKLALADLQKFNKASKMNKPRLMYHYSKLEAAYGFSYLLLLFLDRWIILFSGDELLGLVNAQSPQYSIASGASLLFFLLTATFLDFIANSIWRKISNMPQVPFKSTEDLKFILLQRTQYQKQQFSKYLLLFVGGGALILSCSTCFLWIYANSWETVIVYGVLCFSYCGLLWAIYCKLFTPLESSSAVLAMFVSAFVGLAIGIPLHKIYPNSYTDQVTFAFSSWLAGLFSWYSVMWNYKDQQDLLDRPNLTTGQHSIGESPNLHSHDVERHLLGYVHRFSIEITPDSLLATRILERLTPKSSFLTRVFKNQLHLLEEVKIQFIERHIRLFMVPEGRLIMQNNKAYTALPIKRENSLHVYIGLPLEIKNQMILDTFYNINSVLVTRICEALIHEVMENLMGYRHCEAVLSELILADPQEEAWAIPRRIQAELERFDIRQSKQIVINTRAQIVKHLLYNIEIDFCWDSISHASRMHLLERVLGYSKASALCVKEIRDLTKTKFTMDELEAASSMLSLMAVMVYERANEVLSGYNSGGLWKTPVGLISLEAWATNPYQNNRKPKLLTRAHFKVDRIARLAYSLISGDLYIPREIYEMTQSLPSFLQMGSSWLVARSNAVYRSIFLAIVGEFIWKQNKQLMLLKNSFQGIQRLFKNNQYIQILNPLAPETAFIESKDPILMHHYDGILTSKPVGKNKLTRISYYDDFSRLTKQTFFKNGLAIQDVLYHYEKRSSVIPMFKEVMSIKNGEIASTDIFHYNQTFGHVTRGNCYRGGHKFQMEFEYAEPLIHQELLRIRYMSDTLNITTDFCVNFGKSKKSIPTFNIQRVDYEHYGETFQIAWDYSMKRHPVLLTLDAEGYEVYTPAFITNDEYLILKKPSRLFFASEDVLFFENHSKKAPNVKRLEFSTRNARSALWKVWFSSNSIDGVWARMIDEFILRREETLKEYWSKRDSGQLAEAILSLEANENAISAAMYIDDDISSKTHFAIKMPDLYLAGQGGDSFVSSLRPTNKIPETSHLVQVYGLQTGTWPAANGGVSNCVRDMVDNLKSARWNILSETGNDLELIVGAFQIEENVNSVCLLPLWGFDWLDHCHNLTCSKTDFEIEYRRLSTDEIAAQQLIAILKRMFKYVNMSTYTKSDLDAATRVFMDYYDFFQVYHYGVWNDKLVRLAFIEILTLSISPDSPEIEQPTVGTILSLMEFIKRSFFCFTVQMPENAPDMVQVTHHAIGSIYGVLMKIRLGCALHVWDHGVLWREYLSQWSGSQCRFRPFVFNAMVKIVRLTATIALNSADVILPCTSISNPLWETERGSAHGRVEHRKSVSRRIDPLVNGVSKMDDYYPDPSAELEDPTVVMLSHIVQTKDIKTALLSWDVIVNQFGLKKLFLDIYGSTDKVPWYTIECETLLSTLNLKENVKLRGFGNAKSVLKSAWLILNSSMTEGLPLALGEAGLSGQPIVCTEAGGSREVIQTDEGHVLGKTVNPGSPYDLAMGQLTVLGLFDGLEDVAEGRDPSPDAVKLADYVGAGRFDDIYQRILQMKTKRRKLGLRLRELVQQKFSGERYLREHEQMLWIGKRMTENAIDMRSELNVESPNS